MGDGMTEEIWRPPIANQIKRFKHWPDYPLKPKHVFLATGIQGIRAYQVIDAIKRRKARSHIAIGLAWGRR
jgi:hypothetical protein